MSRATLRAASLCLALAAVAFAGAGSDAVVLGVVPGDDAEVTRSLVDGARLALHDAEFVEIRVGEAGGRWGNAASTAVRLARSDHAAALIAPPDRATAHLVVQVATKARVPVVSTSPAASVTQAGSTWVVSVVPAGGTASMPAAARDAFRKRHERDPDDAACAGYAAARVFLQAWRRDRDHGGGLMPALRRVTEAR